MLHISIDQLRKSDNRYQSYKQEKTRTPVEHMSAEALLENIDPSISKELLRGNIIGNDKNILKRKEMIAASGHEPAAFAFERAIGNNDSVYSNFIDLIMDAKKKVGRIVIKEDNRNLGYATGFMVSENLLLTNWHVFKSIDEVNDSVVQFNYELDVHGNPSTSISFLLAPDTFFYSFEELDYCLIAVEQMDSTGKHPLSTIGYIYLDPTMGKLGNEQEELLNIIHHPKGDYKQLSIRENRFSKILSTTIWYESDTAQGSSGSPVFNDQWQVVALHHMGVAKKDGDNYLDKAGKIIPIVNGKIDVSRIHWIANEGIRISVIRRHIISIFPNSALILKLISKPAIKLVDTSNNPSEYTAPSQQSLVTSTDAVQISIPNHLIESQKRININITTESIFDASRTLPNQSIAVSDVSPDEIEAESFRLERSMDYSECNGYRSNFLGEQFRVPIPKPQDSIKNHIAKLTGSRAYILRYYKFSVIFNELKRMPLISAINIDGNEDKRQDFSKRKDVWIRDNRINLDGQLNNPFYLKSGFDRGHMSRREDANWGDGAFEAKRNADLTCVQTNACPQVPQLNRSNFSGLWGKLEKIILEKGAKKEEGKKGRISVFSGPVFAEADPIYKGVKIPMKYFKVVLWKSDENQLKATAFVLSQSDLVEEIDFEEIGVDQDINFKAFQCSIEDLQRQTNIDFEDFLAIDTFKEVEEEILIQNEAHLLEMLQVSLVEQ